MLTTGHSKYQLCRLLCRMNLQAFLVIHRDTPSSELHGSWGVSTAFEGDGKATSLEPTSVGLATASSGDPMDFRRQCLDWDFQESVCVCVCCFPCLRL